MNTIHGLLGIAGIWLTMAMMPIAELLALSPTQATFLRGLSGVVSLGSIALFRSRFITMPDWYTLRIVAFFVIATMCVFQAIVSWGANYMALFLDLAVLVPLWFAWRSEQTLKWGTWAAFFVAIVGTVLTLRVYQGGVFAIDGFLWSLGALISNGLFIQYAGTAMQKNWNKAFWMSFGLMLAGIPAIGSDFGFGRVVDGFGLFLFLAIFAVSTGILNFYFVFLAFANLSAVAVGVLVLGVTPAIILSSYLMLGTAMGTDQLFGVALTLGAVLVFGSALRHKEK